MLLGSVQHLRNVCGKQQWENTAILMFQQHQSTHFLISYLMDVYIHSITLSKDLVMEVTQYQSF